MPDGFSARKSSSLAVDALSSDVKVAQFAHVVVQAFGLRHGVNLVLLQHVVEGMILLICRHVLVVEVA